MSLNNASSGYTSKGAAITYTVTVNDGGTPSDLTDDVHTLTATAGTRTVFTLEIDANGDYTFTLKDQIDHSDGSDPDDETLTIDFSSFVQFTDFDDDTIVLSGGFSITVENDIPLANGAAVTRTVDEDDIDTTWSEGTSPDDGNGDGSFTGDPNVDNGGPAFVTGTLSGVVSIGADEVPVGTAVYGFASDIVDQMEALGLFSKQSVQPASEQRLAAHLQHRDIDRDARDSSGVRAGRSRRARRTPAIRCSSCA